MTRSSLIAAFAALLVVSPAPALGQVSVGSEALIRQVDDPGATDAETLSILTGLGLASSSTDPLASALVRGLQGLQSDGNTLVVRQTGLFNRASLLQSGSRNVAAILQDGTANRIDVVQEGHGNLLGAWLVGSRNALSVVQQGDDNRYFLDFVGDDLSHEVIQLGSGLRAIQFGEGSLPFGIRQEGIGAEIRIEHNRAGGIP